jgi:hypothetical protein
MDHTWAIVGVGGFLGVISSRIPREEGQVGPCEQLGALSPFKHNMTRKTSHGSTPLSPPHRNYKIAPMLTDISNFSLEISCRVILLKATPMHDAKVHSFHSFVGQPFGMLP